MRCWISPPVTRTAMLSTMGTFRTYSSYSFSHQFSTSSFIAPFRSRSSSHPPNKIKPVIQSIFISNSPSSINNFTSSLTPPIPSSSLSRSVSNFAMASTTTGDIYQRIFDIDIEQAGGIRAVVDGETYSDAEGYVLVSESSSRTTNPSKLLKKIVIPESKIKSYRLAQALFDNYEILSSVEEVITPEERAESEELIEYCIASAPMRLARQFIEQRSGKKFSDGAWFARVYDTWFRPFQIGSSPSRSGFEHVFLGEWKAKNNTVGGLHWWYFYDSLEDDKQYNGAVYNISDPSAGLAVPEIATMTFTWTIDGTVLTKRIGGFFIGPSVEGLMAMGMVRAADEASPPTTCIIEGIEIDLKMFKSRDGRSVNTFYPVLRRVLTGVSTPPSWTLSDSTNGTTYKVNESGSGLRILSAMANPKGNDQGREKITIINLFGDEQVSLDGWKIQGPNKSVLKFGDVSLDRGEARTFDIPKRGSLQLSNRGGEIQFIRPDGSVEQAVTYDRSVAKIQDGVLVWNGDKNLVIFS